MKNREIVKCQLLEMEAAARSGSLLLGVGDFKAKLMGKVSDALERLKRKAETDGDVLAILSFGSYARGERYSDIDLCLILYPRSYGELHLSKKKLEYLAFLGEGFDIQVFQQLPLYVKTRVIKEGKVEFCKDEPALYELAFQTLKEYELFEPVYREYLEAVAGAR